MRRGRNQTHSWHFLNLGLQINLKNTKPNTQMTKKKKTLQQTKDSHKSLKHNKAHQKQKTCFISQSGISDKLKEQ